MGLYDTDDYSYDEPDPEEIGSALVKTTKKSKKGFKIKAPKFKIPDWLSKTIMYILSIFIIIILIYAMYLAFQPSLIDYTLKPNPIYKSNTTESTLTLTITNHEEYTLKNIEINVYPIDNLSVAVMPSDSKIIPILGSGEKRKLKYTVSLIGDAPAGDYLIKIKAKTPAKIYEENVKWTIKEG